MIRFAPSNCVVVGTLICSFLSLCTMPAPAACGDPEESTETALLARIRVSEDGTHFVLAESGRQFVVWGVNYDHDSDEDSHGRLLEDYWQEEWNTVAEDFAEIKALGANTVRIHLQLPQFMETAERTNADNLDQLVGLVKLAEETGLYLDITGLGCYHKQDVPDWYDALDEPDRWAVQARFWQAVAEVCQGSPAVLCYDLMNEPILPGKDKPATEWLTGELGGKHFVQYITLDLEGRTREEVARAWVKQLTDAIREVDQQTLITVGVIPWAHVFPGAKPLFHSPEVGGPLDFVAVHFYPQKGEVEKALTALRSYEVGKPLVVEEMFPLKCSPDELETFIRRSRPFCDGWISFYWGRTAEENRQRGDLAGAIIAAWLERFQSLAAEMTQPAP